VESVAICFLFSYLNPAHEDRAKAIVSEILPDAFVTTSSFISPQFREFERFTTAALAAFIGPKVRMYITHLDRSLKSMGLTADLRIMASNGGVATAGMVSEKPTLTLLSGLAAGVLAGAWIGGLAERRKLITFDIGGTSADIGIIVDGRLAETDARSTSIAGFPLLSPMIDIHTIGAGGGSIAYIDHGGAFRVGPRSAGAVPGPAAYGMGGEEPTVTDANLVLGRLDADDFLGGGM
jgi:N-methylhydantoinase A